jgi:hypothetical protein
LYTLVFNLIISNYSLKFVPYLPTCAFKCALFTCMYVCKHKIFRVCNSFNLHQPSDGCICIFGFLKYYFTSPRFFQNFFPNVNKVCLNQNRREKKYFSSFIKLFNFRRSRKKILTAAGRSLKSFFSNQSR